MTRDQDASAHESFIVAIPRQRIEPFLDLRQPTGAARSATSECRGSVSSGTGRGLSRINRP